MSAPKKFTYYRLRNKETKEFALHNRVWQGSGSLINSLVGILVSNSPWRYSDLLTPKVKMNFQALPRDLHKATYTSLPERLLGYSEEKDKLSFWMNKVFTEWELVEYKLEEQPSLTELLKITNAWADKTFPTQTIPGLTAHIASEAEELKNAPDDSSEMADIVSLVAYLAHLQGIDLVKAIKDKHEVNLTRTWKDADPLTGMIKHVEN